MMANQSPSPADSPASDHDAIDLGSAWSHHARWLRTVLAARGVEPAALDEVLQDVLTEAWRSLSKLRDAARLGPWLYRIAVGQALQHRRRLGRQRKLLASYVQIREVRADADDTDPLAWLLADEQRRMVRQALAQLRRQDSEILLLKYTEDWSYRALSEHLGISEAAVEARLHRARGRLRQALARQEQQSPVQTPY